MRKRLGYKPGFVITEVMMVIHLGRQLLAASSSLPESQRERAALGVLAYPSFLFGFASNGVYLATQVTLHAGELLPHRFTLTYLHRRFAFCCTCPDQTINYLAGRRYRPSRSVKPGLSSRSKRTSDHPPSTSSSTLKHRTQAPPQKGQTQAISARKLS